MIRAQRHLHLHPARGIAAPRQGSALTRAPLPFARATALIAAPRQVKAMTRAPLPFARAAALIAAPRQVKAMTRASRQFARAATLIAAAALCSCGTTAPMRYFTLEAVAPEAASSRSDAAAQGAAYRGPPLQVRQVRIPPALDRPELVRDLAPDQVEIRESEHWAAPLGKLARQALTENLAARLPSDRLVFPGASWPAPGADLTVDVLSFKVANGVAAMVLTWTVRPSTMSSDAAPALPHPNEPVGAHLRLQTPAGDDAAARARAWSVLLAQLSDRVIADLAQAAD